MSGIARRPARPPHSLIKQWRQTFITIARERAFDPLVASNWYKLRRGELKVKVCAQAPCFFFLFLFFLIEVQQKYRRMFNYVGVSKALVAAFPTLEFDSSKLWSTGNIQEASPLLLSRYSLSCINLLPLGFKYYKVVENQKRAFENVAKDEGFDPLVAENWYNVDKDTLYNYPVGVCSPFYLTFFCFLLSSLSWSSHFNI